MSRSREAGSQPDAGVDDAVRHLQSLDGGRQVREDRSFLGEHMTRSAEKESDKFVAKRVLKFYIILSS